MGANGGGAIGGAGGGASGGGATGGAGGGGGGGGAGGGGGGGGGGVGSPYGPPAHTGLAGWLMHAGSAGPVGGPVMGGGGGGGPGGGGGAYGPPWHTGYVGICAHRGSSGPVGGPGGGPGGCSGAGARDVPARAGIPLAGTAAPVAATTMSAPATAPFATMSRTSETLVQLIFCSSVPHPMAGHPNLLTPKHIRPYLLPDESNCSNANPSSLPWQAILKNFADTG
ncbi:hypothetical protein BST21_13025 [Mycolicibacterium celeriflavum]|nr:hypothetical protein BST21_13025 [Mycolicibacterium celeriflavum]